MFQGPAILAAVIAFCLFGMPAAAQDTSTDAADAPAQAVAVEPTARDAAIEMRIQDILEATGWFSDPGVDVREGVAFLDGVASSDERRRWAGDLARKTQDVVAVVNRMEVAEEGSWSLAPAWREISRIGSGVLQAGPLVLLAIAVLPLAWIAARLTARLADRLLDGRIDSPFLRLVVARLIAAPVFLLGLYFILQVAGLTQLALSLLGGAGVVGIIVGFAFRDIAENFLASLLLSIRQPFKRGDFIDVDGREGVVQSMNTRSTILMSVEGNHITIPNATVFKNTIVNYTAAPARRGHLDVGIGYDASIADAQAVIMSVLDAHPALLKDPEPLVLVDSLGSATVNLRAYYWVDARAYSMMKVRSALLRLVERSLTDAGVSMPDEAREIIFPEGVPVRQIADEDAAPPMPAPSPTAEPSRPVRAPESSATDAEGDLETEQHDLEAHAARSALPEGGADLLDSEDPEPDPLSGRA